MDFETASQNIIDAANRGGPWTILGLIATLFLTILSNLKAIYDLWDVASRRKISRLKEIKDFFGENSITEKSKVILREKINSMIFEIITGIKADKYLRERVMALYENSKGRLSYDDFRKARFFLEIKDDGSLEIRNIRIPDRAAHYFNRVVSLLYFLMGSLLLIVSILATNLIGRLILILCASFIFALALFTMSQSGSLPAAEKIKGEIENWQG